MPRHLNLPKVEMAPFPNSLEDHLVQGVKKLGGCVAQRGERNLSLHGPPSFTYVHDCCYRCAKTRFPIEVRLNPC